MKRSLLLLFLAVLSQSLFAAEKPNIVFIFADDMGYMDLGCYGSDLYRTPNIDRLGTQGTRFTQMRTAAHVCSPTRASVLTGKFPARLHVTDWLPGHPKPFAKLLAPEWQKEGVPQAETTIAEALKAQGYATAWFGKWHAGGGANDHGFDAGTQDWEENRKDDPKDPKGVFTLTTSAVDFIAKNRNQPFFVALSHYSVHGPIRFEPGLKAEYEKIIADKKPRQTNAGYAAMVEALDTSVGQLLDFLEKEDLAKKTLVIFTSDNGGVPNFTNNAPLRAGKGTLYDGGIRVPMIARWPGHIPAGQTSDARLCSIDFLPTFTALAGGKAEQVDGIDATAALQGKATPTRDTLYWHYPHYHAEKPSGAIIKGDWKLIEWFETGKTELFHLAVDPNEEKDLATENTAKNAELLSDLKAWREKVGAQMMSPNAAYDPARAEQGAPKKPKKEKKDKPAKEKKSKEPKGEKAS